MSYSLSFEFCLGCCSIFMVLAADSDSMPYAFLQAMYAFMAVLLVLQDLLMDKASKDITSRISMGNLKFLKYSAVIGIILGTISNVVECYSAYDEYVNGNRLVKINYCAIYLFLFEIIIKYLMC